MKSTHAWLLRTASYGHVNAKAKWESKYEKALPKLGLEQLKHVNQLFYRRKNNQLLLICGKLVDDIIAAGSADNVTNVLSDFHQMSKL